MFKKFRLKINKGLFNFFFIFFPPFFIVFKLHYVFYNTPLYKSFKIASYLIVPKNPLKSLDQVSEIFGRRARGAKAHTRLAKFSNSSILNLSKNYLPKLTQYLSFLWKILYPYQPIDKIG